jgi:hypothetical protein
MLILIHGMAGLLCIYSALHAVKPIVGVLFAILAVLHMMTAIAFTALDLRSYSKDEKNDPTDSPYANL